MTTLQTHISLITQTHKEFENKSNIDELPYLFGEIQQCAITAARFVVRCRKRATSETQTTLFICFPFDTSTTCPLLQHCT
jgi:hypothetical protein